MIKLKEELKNISNNKLSKIKKIAKQVRHELETYYDWDSDKRCFKNMCSAISEELAKKLKSEGIYSYTVHGFYYGASDEFEPDMSDWDSNEVEEYFEWRGSNEPFGFNHWWVVADNRWIVDITADQFHPGEEDEYRVVITQINDQDYSI